MRRHTLLIAVVGTALLIGAATLLQDLLFRDDVEAGRAPSMPSPPPPALVADTSRPDDGAAEPAPSSARLAVAEAGALERREGDRWAPLAAGDALNVDDRIRTTSRGRAVLRTATGDRIELVDEVEISVEALTRSLAELELTRGRLRADLDDDSDLALRVRSSGATAEARAGAFMVFADGTGMVAVASETAEVRLRAHDEEVTVAAGQQSVVPAGQAPSSPEDIPDEVFLHVAWPSRRAQREHRLVVRGRATPGSEVRVGDTRVPVSADGRFETRVQLDAGPNRVTVWTRDPAGRTRSEEGEVLVRDRPPRLEVVSPGSWGSADQ